MALNWIYGMTTSRDEPERTVTVDASDPDRGCFDPTRFRHPNPSEEPYPVITPEDRAATRAELNELRRRMTRKTA